MKLAVGADHAGYKMKWQIVEWLRSRAGGKYQILDVGTISEESVDYPDFAADVARLVAKKRAPKGLLFCGSGTGMAIAANKIRGIRSGVAWNPLIASLASEHNGVNVLCLPARYISLAAAKAIIKSYLNTPFGGGRHLRRVKKITALDRCA